MSWNNDEIINVIDQELSKCLSDVKSLEMSISNAGMKFVTDKIKNRFYELSSQKKVVWDQAKLDETAHNYTWEEMKKETDLRR